MKPSILRKKLKDCTYQEVFARAVELSEGQLVDERPMIFCTASELMSALGARSMNMGLVIQLPTNGKQAETFTLTVGNKFTVRGLVDALYDSVAEQSGIQVIEASDEGYDNGDDDGSEDRPKQPA